MLRICLFAFIVLLASCNNGKDKPDVSDIRVDARLDRFEQAFFGMDTANVPQSLSTLYKKFPEFYPVFMDKILGLEQYHRAEANGNVTMLPLTDEAVRQFIEYHAFLHDSLRAKYRDMDWLKRDLDQSLRYVKHYFPSYKIPSFTTYIGPMNTPGTVVLENTIGIGLHQYAGKNASIYSAPEIVEMYPLYISRRFDKEYMVANSIMGVVSAIYPDSSKGRPLIEQMVEKGKEWLLLDKFLPDAPDSVKTGFSQDQLEWCEEHEGNIWSQVTRMEDIYTLEPSVIQNYIGPAPFTQGMPQEYSPGNLGQWIGWRIVQRYAEKNPAMTLQQILQTPARKIFSESKYKPK